MTPEILRRCAAAYGSARGLATALSINERMMRFYLNGDRPIPEWINGEIARALKARSAVRLAQAAACRDLADELTRSA